LLLKVALHKESSIARAVLYGEDLTRTYEQNHWHFIGWWRLE